MLTYDTGGWVNADATGGNGGSRPSLSHTFDLGPTVFSETHVFDLAGIGLAQIGSTLTVFDPDGETPGESVLVGTTLVETSASGEDGDWAVAAATALFNSGLVEAGQAGWAAHLCRRFLRVTCAIFDPNSGEVYVGANGPTASVDMDASLTFGELGSGTGPTGVTGPQGATGPAGATGPQGADATSAAVRVEATTTQALPTAVFTAIQFDVVAYDIGGLRDEAHPTRLVLPVDGVYALVGQVGLAGPGGADYDEDLMTSYLDVKVQIQKNGGPGYVVYTEVAPVRGGGMVVVIPGQGYFEAGDYVELQINHQIPDGFVQQTVPDYSYFSAALVAQD